MKVAEKLKRLRLEHGLTQKDIAEIAGVSPQSVSYWESGDRAPKIGSIRKLCDYFHLDLNAFVDNTSTIKPMLPANSIPYSEMRIAPIVGTIPAGYPALAIQDIEGYATIPYHDGSQYFFLRVKGDSMTGAGIHPGDLVLIRQQSCAEDGQIIAARVDGDEATLKRYRRQDDSVLLLPENPEYKPRIVPAKDFETGDAQIIGVALEVRHEL